MSNNKFCVRMNNSNQNREIATTKTYIKKHKLIHIFFSHEEKCEL